MGLIHVYMQNLPTTKEIMKDIDHAEQKFTLYFLGVCFILIAFGLGSLFLYEPKNCKGTRIFGRAYWQGKYDANPIKYAYLSRRVNGVQNNIICEGEIEK